MRWSAVGLLVLAVAAGVVAYGESLATSPQPESARAWLLAAAVLGLVGVRLVERDLPDADSAPRPVDRTRPDPAQTRSWREAAHGALAGRLLMAPGSLAGGLLMAAGAFGSLVAMALVVAAADEPTPTWIWTLSLLATAGGAALLSRRPSRAPASRGATSAATDATPGSRPRPPEPAIPDQAGSATDATPGSRPHPPEPAIPNQAGSATDATLGSRRRLSTEREPATRGWRRSGLLEMALLITILGLAAWLRVPGLATLPPNLHGDEMSIGLDARQILAGEMPPVFAVGWYEVPALSFSFHALTMQLFGDDVFGLRMASVIEGLLSIGPLYLLTRRLWGRRPALIAATLLAVAAWHIQFSRTGFHYMQAPLATLLVLFFVVRGIQERRILDWVLCGFAVGLCLEVYYAARIAPLLAAVYVGYRSATERGFLRLHARGLLALVFGSAVFLAPMAAVFVQDPDVFNARAAGVLVTAPTNLQHELDAYRVESLQQVLTVQVQRTLEAFNIRGETSLQYGHPAPLLDVWTGGLVAIGTLAVFARPGTARGALLAAWVWLTLFAGSVMTIDALFSPRVLPVLPALALGAALLLDTVWRGITLLAGRRGMFACAVPIIVLLGAALRDNAHDYFDIQVVERQPAGRFTLLATYAVSIADQYRLYAIGRSDWSLSSEAPRFLLPDPDAVNVRNAPLALPLDVLPLHKGAAFLVENLAPDYDQRMQLIRSTYPEGTERVIFERAGAPSFTSYLVDNTALSAANPDAARR